jgi:hypothetical protein
VAMIGFIIGFIMCGMFVVVMAMMIVIKRLGK